MTLTKARLLLEEWPDFELRQRGVLLEQDKSKLVAWDLCAFPVEKIVVKHPIAHSELQI